MRSKNNLSEQHRQYSEVRELLRAAAKTIADNGSIVDCTSLVRFLRRNEFSQEMISRLSSVEYNRAIYESMKRYDRESESNRLVVRLDEVRRKAGKRRRRIRHLFASVAGTGVAAAAVIGGWFYFSGGTTHENQVHRQISLILSDGRTISLDNPLNNLDLEEETDAFIRNTDGTLIVEKKDDAAQQMNAPNHYTLDVSEGYQYDIILEDKTHIWLNSDSYLRFPASFGPDERKVFVEGEAYFEVAEDRGRPFIVETSGQTITVLGTAFNLYAYRDEPVIYTTLLSGSVAVRSAAGEVTLVPNQSCGLNRYDNKFSVRDVKAQTVAEWRNAGIFVFDDNTLEQVLMKVSRWYGVEIVFDETDARTFIYRGNLPRYEKVEELLESLEITGSMKFTKEKNRYVMTR